MGIGFKVEKVTPDGREVVRRDDGETLFEVRIFVAHVYGPGVVHVGSGLSADMAVEAALGFATKCGTRASEVKKMRRALESGVSDGGRVFVMPKGVTHIGVGPMGSCWIGGDGSHGAPCTYNPKTYKWEVLNVPE